MNKEDGVVVDLRTGKEFAGGHIVGAINIPSSEFANRMSELDQYKDSPVILVCKMGQHSSGSSKTLKEAGFSNVKRMTGGMAEWTGANLPVVKTKAKEKGKEKGKGK